MAKKGEEIVFRYLIEDQDGEVTDEVSQSVMQGYFEFWGQSTMVVEHGTPMGVFPIAIIVPVGIAREKQTGKVYLCKPNHIVFK